MSINRARKEAAEAPWPLPWNSDIATWCLPIRMIRMKSHKRLWISASASMTISNLSSGR